MNNVDLVQVTPAAQVSGWWQDLTFDLSGGEFATVSGGERKATHFDIADLGSMPSGNERSLYISGSVGSDHVTAGASGLALDSGDDLNVKFVATNFTLFEVDGDAGDDYISAAGGASLGEPLPFAANLRGDAGNDDLTGGSLGDLIDGREGYDFANGGLGGDTCWSTEEVTSCEMPLESEPATWLQQCDPGIIAATCSGGGQGFEDDGMGGGVSLAGPANGRLPGSGRATATGTIEEHFYLSEDSSSVSITTRHYIDWAAADLNGATLGSSAVILTVMAFDESCLPACKATASRTIVASATGPVTMATQDLSLDIELTNGDDLLPTGRVDVYITFALKVEMGRGLVPSTGSPYATVTNGYNSLHIRPNP